MLLDPEHVNQPAPEAVWFDAVADYAEQTPAEIKAQQIKQMKRLRRMQSENMVQRAAHHIIDIFAGNREAA